MQEAYVKNDVAGAKIKYAEIEKKFSSTRIFRRAAKLSKELEVFGKAAPSGLIVDEWYIGDASAVNFSKGVSLVIFWEVWCPHCKRGHQTSHSSKTFDTYNKQGLKDALTVRVMKLEKVIRVLQKELVKPKDDSKEELNKKP
jgi:thiol-disulfide isomerase/thioredoxin